uniref:C-type lectin domain-containing protein n=1 Tax=Myripristis murdjan TaxID=586833 RepID=A0A667WZ90_9TELE
TPKRYFFPILGLGSLPSCFPRQYLLVEEKMNWTEAQSYCRQHYTDLATVSSEEDVAKLNDTVGSHRSWIGLYDDINSWRWSLQNKSYYGEGEAEFRMWDSGQPDNSGSNEHCVVMNPGGLWFVSSCFSARPFVCYNGSSRWILVNKDKSWSDAQSYCRQNYTDLASIRNLTENEEIRGLISNSSWIGLFRGTWKWSDGSTMSFTKWDDNRPYGGYWRCYHLVEKSMTWSEAQSYCRQHYTDLATVSSEEDVAKLNDAVGSHHSGIVWIGLYDDINSWKWSLQNKSYYGEGEAEFRMWGTGQPNNYNDEHCVFMDADGEWWDYYCSRRYPFVCYNGENKTTAVNS